MSGILKSIYSGLHHTLGVWCDEMTNLFRDQGVLLFCIVVPLVYPLLYSWIYNNEVVRDMPVVVVDYDHSATSRSFIRRMDASPEVSVQAYVRSPEEAEILMAQQKVRGVVLIPADFAKKIARTEQAHVSVFCDMSLMLAYKAVYQTAMEVSSEMNAEIQLARTPTFTKTDGDIRTEPIVQHEISIFNPTTGYANSLLPPVLMLILHQTLLLGIGLSAGTMRERKENPKMVEIGKQPFGITHIVLGKALCYVMVAMVMGTYIGLAVPRFFSFTSMNTAAHFFPFLFLFVLATTFFGMAVSGLIRQRENVMLLVVFTSVPLLFLSGTSWPTSNIPILFQYFSYLFPATFGTNAYVTLSSMGGTLSDIRLECIGLSVQCFVYFVLSCWVYRRQLQRFAAALSEGTQCRLVNSGVEEEADS